MVVDRTRGTKTERATVEQALAKWEWEGDPPTQAEALASLATLPEVWGVKTVDFAVHVLPMSQLTTIYLGGEGNRVGSKKLSSRESQVLVWKLYTQVAGRLLMLNQAVAINEWQGADFVPAEFGINGTGGANPAFVGTKETVYREFLVIRDKAGVEIGKRPGMASLKASGRVPPWEKLETAARGRALGAWGFGVLPGSGIASLEEMELARYDDLAAPEEPAPIRSREDIEHDLFVDLEQYRTVRGRDQDQVNKYLIALALELGGKTLEIKDGRVDLSPLSDPQAELVRRRVADSLKTVRSDAQPL